MKAVRIITLTMLALSTQLTLFAGDAENSIDQKLVRLEEQLKEQNTRIAALQTELEQSRIESAVAQEKAGGPIVSLGNGSENLKIKADLRVRYEQRDRADQDPTNDQGVDRRRRFRQRFRLGMEFKTPWGWKAKAGLATGDFDGGSGAAGATSTNDTYGEDDEFETGGIGLDYAYVEHSWNDTSLAIGQQKNPYKNAGILWDSDVRPVGLVIKQELGPAFITAGAHDVLYGGSNNAEGLMGALQAGVNLKNDAVKGTLATAYYRYNNEYSGLVGLDPHEYNFELIDLYGDVGFDIGDVGSVSLFGEWTKNIGAGGAVGTGQRGGDIDPKDNDVHYTYGVSAKVDRFSFGLSYIETESDAIPDNLNDADFGTGVAGTDIQGWKAKLGAKLVKNCSLGFTYLKYERIDEFDWEEHGVNRDEGELYQVDVKYKF